LWMQGSFIFPRWKIGAEDVPYANLCSNFCAKMKFCSILLQDLPSSTMFQEVQ